MIDAHKTSAIKGKKTEKHLCFLMPCNINFFDMNGYQLYKSHRRCNVALSVVDSGFDRVKPETMQFVFVAFPLSTQINWKAQTGWL